MLYVGLDLSRKRLDFDARLSSGKLFEASITSNLALKADRTLRRPGPDRGGTEGGRTPQNSR
jgi:hypothetical protein